MENKDIYILGIESSCDETAASVVLNGRKVLSNIISSQIDIHEKFGGVVPEIASRNHIYDISSVVDNAMEEAGIEFKDLDGIGVTHGPGLIGALLVGLNYGKGLSLGLNKPLIGVNHIEGHIYANFICHHELVPPFVSLVVSGGHTHLVYVKDYKDFEILGRTRDDAAGESFDKVARAMGLGYPGGPKIERAAKEGNEDSIDFPRAMMDDGLDFSFSGVKSAVLNYLNEKNMKNEDINIPDVAASFQKAVSDVLVNKSILACKEKNSDILAIAGGVSSNQYIRNQMAKRCIEEGIKFYVPNPIYCTDNAAMIASSAYYEYINGNISDLSLNAYANLDIS